MSPSATARKDFRRLCQTCTDVERQVKARSRVIKAVPYSALNSAWVAVVRIQLLGVERRYYTLCTTALQVLAATENSNFVCELGLATGRSRSGSRPRVAALDRAREKLRTNSMRG